MTFIPFPFYIISEPECNICGRTLDDPSDPTTEDCGGDCLRCMAEAGDPDCIAAMAELE
jgi:hypothetical protein